MGGSRKSVSRSYINMWATMLISGLWHGAAWTFIAWSVLHSFYLSLERITNWPQRVMKLPLGRHLAALIVFILTVVAWVFFRAQTFSQAFEVLGIMFSFASFNAVIIDKIVDNNAINVLLLIIGSQLFFHFKMDKADWAVSSNKFKLVFDSVFIAVVIMVCVYMRSPSNTFIYFQF